MKKPLFIRKVIAVDPVKTDKGVEFVLSDATPDRYGDVIEATGWMLKEFESNPIALFNHNPDFPIGRWVNVKVVGGKLKGTLQMAPRGTSARIDELLNLVEAGILRAVSVGFLPVEYEQIGKGHGSRYTKQQLVETSLVSIPANPNALAIAKSVGVSPETLEVVFGKNAEKDNLIRRGFTGKNAIPPKTPTHIEGKSMNLTQRIQAKQARIKTMNEQLEAATAKLGTDEETAALETIEALTAEIEVEQKSLASLEKAEKLIAKTVVTKTEEPIVNRQLPTQTQEDETASYGNVQLPARIAKLFAEPVKQKTTPMDLLVRGIAIDIKHYGEGRKRDIKDVLTENYGQNAMSEGIRRVMAQMVTRAAAIPADTTTSGWADTLVQTVIGDFIEALMPYSVYPKLRALGGSFTFGRNGAISFPARNQATTLAGAFVAQGAAIPVRQGAFTPITLTPKKMGVITTMTREITEHSTPAIEAILKQAMLEDTAVAIDTVLLDATASSTTRPAGLRNGISKITVSGTASIVGFIADMKALLAALITATNGNLRKPVWIMNPGDALAISLLQTTTGDTPFREEIARGTLLGFPIATTTTGTSDLMGIIDAADFMTATGDTPQFTVSDQAVLHMEDTSPAALSTVATPNTVAAPIRSLFQTDSLAIRMIMDINWAKRRAGIFQWADTMVWN